MAKTQKPRPKGTPKNFDTTPYLSIVVPLLDEEESLGELYASIVNAVEVLKKPFEIIFVDDGSTDQSFSVLEGLHAKDSRVKAIRFRRNFGKSAALSVGFHESRG